VIALLMFSVPHHSMLYANVIDGLAAAAADAEADVAIVLFFLNFSAFVFETDDD